MAGLLQNKFLTVLLGAAIFAAGGWYVFLRDTSDAPLVQTQDLTATTAADKEVVETLLQLRAITLSGTILSDPAFVRLKDTGTQIVPEPVGRSNPFLPLQFATGTPQTGGN